LVPKRPKKARSEKRARAPLTRERILGAGLRLLENSPGTALSMRALAEELGAAPMSLYRHVRNREDLLEGINEIALRSLHLEIPTEGDWRERALIWMHSLRRELHEQPAVAPLLRLRGSLAPTLFQVLDALLRIVLDAGFQQREAALACREIAWFTMSFVANEMRHQAPNGSSQAPPGVDLGSFEQLSQLDLSKAPELAALLPAFASIGIDEIFSGCAEHLLEGLSRSLEVAPEYRPRD
jgi:AcrR family transcriptional regulator